MTMMIAKFHKLIQSKVMWLGILIVVAVSMVFFGAATNSGRPVREATSPGTLNGKPVSPEVFQRARLNTYVGITLMIGRAINLTDEINQQLDRAAWNRLVTLDQAHAMGISATDEEVSNAIRMTDLFQSEGRFDKRNYDAFAQQFLRGLGMTQRDFEEHVREEITVQKLRSIIDRSFLVSPLEVQRTFHSLSDELTIEYGLLTPDLVQHAVEISEEEARAFYNEDPERFRQPEKLTLRVATLDAALVADQVEVTDDEIQEYYDFNLDQFEVVVDTAGETNDTEKVEEFTEVADPETNPAAETFSFDDDLTSSVTEYKPLEEVRGDIVEILKQKQAAALAEQRAEDFVNELGRIKGNKQEAFITLAEKQAIPLTDLAPLSRDDELPEPFDALGTQFLQAALTLTDDGDYSYSDPVPGSNAVYVLSLVDRVPERVPDFEEVRDQVVAMASEVKVVEKLNELADAVKVEAEKLVAEGDPIDSLLTSYGVPVEKPAPFTAATAEFEQPYAEFLLRGVLVCNSGEVTDPIPVEDGILIAHVLDRTPADTLSMMEVRPQIINQMRRQNSGQVFETYQDYLMKEKVTLTSPGSTEPEPTGEAAQDEETGDNA